MTNTSGLSYVAQRHLTSISKDTGERIDYAPGDLIADFETWEEYPKRVHLEGGFVAMTLKSNATPPVNGGRPVNNFGAPSAQRVPGPQSSHSLDEPSTDAFSVAGSPFVPIGEDKPPHAVPDTSIKAAVQSRMSANIAAIAAGETDDADESSIMPREAKPNVKKQTRRVVSEQG